MKNMTNLLVEALNIIKVKACCIIGPDHINNMTQIHKLSAAQQNIYSFVLLCVLGE